MKILRYHIEISGIVQGVGFRPFIFGLCSQHHLVGFIKNTSSGVDMEVQGNNQVINTFLKDIRSKAPPLAFILDIQAVQISPKNPPEKDFTIQKSQSMIGRTLISPDVNLCADCQKELDDRKDRRYYYPFINCTNCGPRYSIIKDVPYDRPKTSMAKFHLCPNCLKEYQDPQNRRFHAQPIACDVCGPQIWFTQTAQFRPPSKANTQEALSNTIKCLNSHGIVGIKGLGGFHLACRFDSPQAIQSLRRKKNRPKKPFAIMFPNIKSIKKYCFLDSYLQSLLTNQSSPILLLVKKPHTSLLNALAPNNAYLGVMLPYTPLHHLLLKKINTPLVMTSGNVSGEPICYQNKTAYKKLNPFCDGFLFHNRPIHRPIDDSVVIHTQPIRRSRGYAPVPIILPHKTKQTILCTGSDLKNTIAIAHQNLAFLSQHIGDLSTSFTRTYQKTVVTDTCKLFKLKPDIVACDLHPQFVSSKFAQKYSEINKVPLLKIQHHHAHLAACLAENKYPKKAIGICFDGTGFGTDGHIWGGEFGIVDNKSFKRLCHLQYLPLPGGDNAIKKPYRTAIAYLANDLSLKEISTLFKSIPLTEIKLIIQMAKNQFNTPFTSSMGRLFDVVSAVLGICLNQTHEAEAPIALEYYALKSSSNHKIYPYTYAKDQIILLPLLQSIIKDLHNQTPINTIAYKFHHTISCLCVETALKISSSYPSLTHVVLSGGVWQNQLLTKLTLPLLTKAGFKTLTHHQVPTNDGGIAYGQAVIASSII